MLFQLLIVLSSDSVGKAPSWTTTQLLQCIRMHLNLHDHHRTIEILKPIITEPCSPSENELLIWVSNCAKTHSKRFVIDDAPDLRVPVSENRHSKTVVHRLRSWQFKSKHSSQVVIHRLRSWPRCKTSHPKRLFIDYALYQSVKTVIPSDCSPITPLAWVSMYLKTAIPSGSSALTPLNWVPEDLKKVNKISLISDYALCLGSWVF